MKLYYVVREGFAGLFRTKFASFTSLLSLFLSILLLSVLFRVGYSAYEFTQLLKNEVTIEIFLENISRERTTEFRQYLQDQHWIQGLEYVSRQEAAERFKAEFGEEAESLVELNFLPASFILQIVDTVKLSTVQEQVSSLKEIDVVDEVVFNAALLEILEQRTETLVTVGLGVGAFILLVSLLLIYNTIRLTIYAKRDLIRAMKLIGATNGYIRGPFVTEGILQGIFAALLASAVHYATFQWLIPEQVPQLGVLAWPFGSWMFLIGAIFFLSLIVGWWGSYWASTRFIGKTMVTRDSLLPGIKRR